MISYSDIFPSLAGADIPSAKRADAIDDGEGDFDRDMDYVEERAFADQGPLTDMDLEEDAQILATLLGSIPSCMHAADIEQLLQDIPVKAPVAVAVHGQIDSSSYHAA
jgi:hypothetical protein